MQVTEDTDEALLISSSQIKPYVEINRSEKAILTTDTRGGLANPRALLFLILWYIFSGCTLFLNKFILAYMEGDPTILGNFSHLVIHSFIR